ncbi:MAG: PEGA domain-containing protein [Betaproteobacteria bacterium]
MNETSTLPSLASVIFARITEFVRRPVAEQARLRAQLEAALAVSLGEFPARSRIVLDAPDGVAVVVLDDPAGALKIAQRCSRVTAAGVPVAIAINHGAVRPAQDEEGLQGLIGDAIGTAAAIAHYAGAGRLIVSRAFRDALAAAAPHRAVGLRPAGVFTDANVRTHEVLSPNPSAPGRRRKVLAAVGAIVMVGFAVAAVGLREDIRLNIYADHPGVLAFDIYPDGDVFVDGVSRGKSPPLAELRLDPGEHVVEVRKKGYPAYRYHVELRPGRVTTVHLAFTPGDKRGFFHRMWESLLVRP